jgi:hypothetical protein
MCDIKSEIEQLNADIIAAHNKHYEVSPTGLIKPNESPNGNGINHLYSNGEITWQKGGSAYMQRSEFTFHNNIPGWQKLGLKLVKPSNYDITYAILTEQECLEFRVRIKELIEKLKK